MAQAPSRTDRVDADLPVIAYEGPSSTNPLAERVHVQALSPAPRSGRQERLANLVNRFV